MRTVGRKRTGQIEQLAPNRYRLKIQHGTGINRKSFNETFDGTRQEAETYLAKLLAKLKEFELVPERAKTVSVLVNDYLTRRARINVSERTLKNYQDIFRRYIKPNIGNKLISEIRAAHVRCFYDDLRLGEYTLGYLDKGEPKLKRGETRLTPAVVHKVHTVLSPAFAYAVEMEWLNINPMQPVAAPKRSGSVKRRVLTPAERDLLFSKCRSASELALWATAYYTGMRPEEYLALRWSDLDLSEGFLKVERVSVEMPGGKKNWIYAEPKTGKSKRTQPLVGTLIEILKTHRREQLEFRMKIGAKWNDHELVFPARHGTPRQNTNINRQFKELLKQSGLPSSIRVYDLRHAFATHLLENGATLKDVSELLGHSSIRVTADTYVHISETRKQSIVNLLENVA